MGDGSRRRHRAHCRNPGALRTFGGLACGQSGILVAAITAALSGAAACGVTILQVHPENPRVFVDAGGQAVLLTGSHHWNNLVDRHDRPPFDYHAYLDLLEQHNHNFFRMWTWEHAIVPCSSIGAIRFYPLPFVRKGPALAFDGKPKFDLTRYNPDYFDRLRARVQQAGEHKIFVSIMLFEGWSILGFDNEAGSDALFRTWQGHPFHPLNNVNGIDGDVNGDGDGIGHEVHTLLNPAVTRIQEGYLL